jgi:8-oxo-dGTP diphosphatase
MDMLKVVCGLIFFNDQILICRRKPEKSLGGFWEFPGGKVELGEDEERSLLRELNEELGMTVTIKKHFRTVVHSYETFTIQLSSYVCQFHNASFILIDHDQYQWIDVVDILNWKLSPADIPIAKELLA